jgi:hypothetical protein
MKIIWLLFLIIYASTSWGQSATFPASASLPASVSPLKTENFSVKFSDPGADKSIINTISIIQNSVPLFSSHEELNKFCSENTISTSIQVSKQSADIIFSDASVVPISVPLLKSEDDLKKYCNERRISVGLTVVK